MYDNDAHGFFGFLEWKIAAWFKDIPDADDYDFKVAQADLAFLNSNRQEASLSWIGHATFLLQFAGLNILTDPQFSNRASPVSWAGPKRAVRPGIALAELPDIDVVVLSHDHYDSLDVASVEALIARNKALTFIVPLGLKPWFDDLDLGANVVELDWRQQHTLNGVTFTAEPVQHWGKRSLLDTNTRLWASWVIAKADKRIYFAGDSGYCPHFKEIGARYDSFDLALIPIGAYAPRWFMKINHVNPEEAVKIHQDVNARHSVGMHWGTFILTDEALDEPPVKLAEALAQQQIPQDDFVVYQHGETRRLPWLNLASD